MNILVSPDINQDNIADVWWNIIDNAINDLTFVSPTTEHAFSPNILTYTTAFQAFPGYFPTYSNVDIGLVVLSRFFSEKLFPLNAVTVTGLPTLFHSTAVGLVSIISTSAVP
jgi:hypothetical protein